MRFTPATERTSQRRCRKRRCSSWQSSFAGRRPLSLKQCGAPFGMRAAAQQTKPRGIAHARGARHLPARLLAAASPSSPTIARAPRRLRRQDPQKARAISLALARGGSHRAAPSRLLRARGRKSVLSIGSRARCRRYRRGIAASRSARWPRMPAPVQARSGKTSAAGGLLARANHRCAARIARGLLARARLPPSCGGPARA